MASRAEQVIAAVEALVREALPGVVVLRNPDTPERVEGLGLVAVRDGEPGEPEVTLSPLSYTYAHAVRIEAAVTGATIAARIAAMDALTTPLAAAIEADRTLGGLCDWIEPTAPDRSDMRADGGASHRWADFDIVATYSTPNPLT